MFLKKDYFLSLPSLPFLIDKSSEAATTRLNRISIPHGRYLRKNVNLCVGQVVSVEKTEVVVKSNESDTQVELPYDYLVVASGSHYGIRWKGGKALKVINVLDPIQLIEGNQLLEKARDIAIIGSHDFLNFRKSFNFY